MRIVKARSSMPSGMPPHTRAAPRELLEVLQSIRIFCEKELATSSAFVFKEGDSGLQILGSLLENAKRSHEPEYFSSSDLRWPLAS